MNIKAKTSFRVFLLTFSCFSTLFSYEGEEEVKTMFLKINNLKNPTFAEYRYIEDFLAHGKRPYLRPFYESRERDFPNAERAYHRPLTHLMLVGENGEMPTFEIFNNNTHLEDKTNCILIYCSYNSPYPNKARLLVKELQDSGYIGHILLRVGGYPNMNENGIELCHIPYSFKVAFLKEAITHGYENILWIDCSMHPLKNLSKIFSIIEERGYLFMDGGVNLDYSHNLKIHLDEALKALNISEKDIPKIPHLVSCIVGINSKNKHASNFIDKWLEETKKVTPCITWYPEEVCFSVLAWQNSFQPIDHWGNKVCTNENIHLIDFFSDWNFLLDLERK